MIDTQTSLARLAHDILDSACPNGGVDGGVDGEWGTYVIETHCIAWRVTARKQDGHWHIRSITSEDC
jgi:hypothetical protein